ncbi:MAG: glucose-6-phosphate isomerase [Campylobacterales bacterium]|nr:glucose-6-phosphate isomerase [Campylobacterales bacterium]
MKNRLYFNSIHSEDLQQAFEAICQETETIGYYALPTQDPQSIIDYAQTFGDHIDTIAVIGIGGSSLGAKAVYEFIKPVKTLKRKLCFFESTDPLNIHMILKEIDLSKTHFLVISKSGTTVETFAIYKYIHTLQNRADAYTFITDPGSPLEAYAKTVGSSVLHLPKNVGGRFSVLSTVGLIPLALSGVDVGSLLEGADFMRKSFFQKGYMHETLLKKANYYAKHHAQYHINCIFAYSEALSYFCQWYVQLWGESLGKRQRHSTFHVGLTPIGLLGPEDQHSFLQLLIEGTRNKSVTFIKIEDFKEHQMRIPDLSLPHLESLDILNSLSFNELINLQCDSVMEALLNEGDIPLDSITLPAVNEYYMGSLIYYYELLTSLVGELIDVDTYDQPGVEKGKVILKQKLARITKKPRI